MRAEDKKMNVVFKNALDKPFNIPRSEVSAGDNSIILDKFYECVFKIVLERVVATCSDSISGNININTTFTKIRIYSITIKTTAAPSIPPAILDSVIIGINAITKALERSIRDLTPHPLPRAVFLCNSDLAPTHLYTHLGTMVAMLPGTVIFPLLRGSERKLSEVLGMQAVGAVAIKAGTDESMGQFMILERMVKPATAAWLPKAKPLMAVQPKALKSASATTATTKETATSATMTTTTCKRQQQQQQQQRQQQQQQQQQVKNQQKQQQCQGGSEKRASENIQQE
ncbi:hypothetical protein BGZ98_008264 [Dissophora globulifera]|nr:hypothetical protein BGZ98_008264 [Dissophora globulifera]